MGTFRIFYILFLLALPGLAQKKLDKAIKMFNNGSVPYIQVADAISQDNVLFLDTRKIEEFEISQIKDAIWVGYDQFDAKKIHLSIPNYNSQIIVYCSIGVRSEDIGEKLLEIGYTNVKNLYGGIFRWKNQGYPIYDTNGTETEKIHAFDKHWGKLLTKGEKVYH